MSTTDVDEKYQFPAQNETLK